MSLGNNDLNSSKKSLKEPLLTNYSESDQGMSPNDQRNGYHHNFKVGKFVRQQKAKNFDKISTMQFGDNYVFLGDAYEEPTLKFSEYKFSSNELKTKQGISKPIRQLKAMEKEMQDFKDNQGLEASKLFANYCKEFNSQNLTKWDENVIQLAKSHDFQFQDCSCGVAVPQKVQDFMQNKENNQVNRVKTILPRPNAKAIVLDTQQQDDENNELESCASISSNESSIQPQSNMNQHYTHHFDIMNSRFFFQYLFVYNPNKKKELIMALVTDWSQVNQCKQKHIKPAEGQAQNQETITHTKGNVYIKMLKIFNNLNFYGSLIAECIQGTGDPDKDTLLNNTQFNVSTIQFKTPPVQGEAHLHYLYFFQRQYFYTSKQADASSFLTTTREKDSMTETSVLQLMRINLQNICNSKIEQHNKILPEPVEGYKIDEEKGRFRNVIFSQPVDSENLQFDTEAQFLNSQFIMLQPYLIENNRSRTSDSLSNHYKNIIQVGSLRDIKDSYDRKKSKQNQDSYDDEESKRTNWPNGICNITQQGQFPIVLVHHFIEHTQKNKKHLTFLLQSTQQFVPLSFKIKPDSQQVIEQEDTQMHGENVSGDFQNITIDMNVQIPIIPVQLLKINLKLINQEKDEKTYFYFIDEQNLVIPIYPLPKEKVLQIRLSEMIRRKIGLSELQDSLEQYSTLYEQRSNGKINYCAGHPTKRLLTILGIQQNKNIEFQLLKSQLHHTFFLGTTECDQVITFIQPSQDKQIGGKVFTLEIMTLCAAKNSESSLILKPQNIEKDPFYYITKQLDQLKFSQELVNQASKTSLLIRRQKSIQNAKQNTEEFNRKHFIPSLLTIQYINQVNLDSFSPYSKSPNTKKSLNKSTKFDQFYVIEVYVSEKGDAVKKTVSVYNMTKFQNNAKDFYQQEKKKQDEESHLVLEQDYQIRLEWQSTYLKEKDIYYVLFFSFQFTLHDIPIKCYFIMNIKSIDLLDNKNGYLFDWDTKLSFIIDVNTIKKESFSQIREQMKTTHQYYFQGIENSNEPESEKPRILQRIDLTFPKCPDNQFLANHVALVYQQYKDKKFKERSFVVYDNIAERFTVFDIQMRQKNIELISNNQEGFENHILCQSSDYYTRNHSNLKEFCQVKYQMLTFFQQEIGMIKIREFLVTQQGLDIEIQIIGMKHIFFSNQFLQSVNYELLANCSFALPLYHQYDQPIKDIQLNQQMENATLMDYVTLPKQEVGPSKKVEKKKETKEENNKQNILIKDYLKKSVKDLKKTLQSSLKEKQTETKIRIDGFRLILFTQAKTPEDANVLSPTNNHIILNFPDTYCNMLYTFQSDLALFGCITTVLQDDSPSQSATIISIRLKKKLLLDKSLKDTDIRMENVQVKPLLWPEESLYLLEKFSIKLMTMTIPDLSYMLLNSFEQLLSKNYFQNQYLLEGRSLCDISINDYQIVYNACESWADSPQQQVVVPTYLLNIVQDDSFRRYMLSMINFKSEIYLLNLDFDMQGTINRAIKCNAKESIKLIISTILELNNYDQVSQYYEIIMFDFIEMLSSRSLEFDFFFSRPMVEESLFNKSKSIRLEIMLTDFALPQFSQNQSDYELIQKSNIFEDNLQRELNNIIIEKEKRNKANYPYKQANFRVEHSYINLSHLQLSTKINDLHNDDDDQHLMKGGTNSMNHLVLSRIIGIKVEQDDLNFFKQKTVQLIINMQYNIAKQLLYLQFLIYLFGYFLPFIFLNISRYSIGDTIKVNEETQVEQIIKNEITTNQDLILKLCMITRLMFISIEFTQMATKKWEYFESFWNWVDQFEFICFILYFLTLEDLIEFADEYLPEITYIVMILAILKFIFFVRMFQSLGFIIMMIWECILSLIPFIITFFTFLLFFTLLLVVLNNDIDAEVAEGAEFLPRFQQAILQTFRTSIGELGMPQYKTIAKKQDSFSKTLNIYMIWLTWYTQCFFNLVVMLNFIIAVINSAYEAVKENQETISFKYRADLNQEVFELQNYMFRLQEFTVIQFSQVNDTEQEQTNRNQNIVNKMTRIINRKKKLQEKMTEGIQKNVEEIKSKTLEMQAEVRQATRQIAGEQNGEDSKHDKKDAFEKEALSPKKVNSDYDQKEMSKKIQEEDQKLIKNINDRDEQIQQQRFNNLIDEAQNAASVQNELKNEVKILEDAVNNLRIQNLKMSNDLNSVKLENKEANFQIVKLTKQNQQIKLALKVLSVNQRQRNLSQLVVQEYSSQQNFDISNSQNPFQSAEKRSTSILQTKEEDEELKIDITVTDSMVESHQTAKVSKQLKDLSQFIKGGTDKKLRLKPIDSTPSPLQVYKQKAESASEAMTPFSKYRDAEEGYGLNLDPNTQQPKRKIILKKQGSMRKPQQ